MNKKAIIYYDDCLHYFRLAEKEVIYHTVAYDKDITKLTQIANDNNYEVEKIINTWNEVKNGL